MDDSDAWVFDFFLSNFGGGVYIIPAPVSCTTSAIGTNYKLSLALRLLFLIVFY